MINLSQSTAYLSQIAQALNKPFYASIEFWTLIIALFIALFGPWASSLISSFFKKSKLKVIETSVINQENYAYDDGNQQNNNGKVADVGRIIIRNDGKIKARAVEPYIEAILWDNKIEQNFLPVPLKWTHGQLLTGGPTIRDIYPNQSVYLDIFYSIINSDMVGERSVDWAIGAGCEVDTFSKIRLGVNDIEVKMYQEDGQVTRIKIRVQWPGDSTPVLSIIE